MRVTSITLCWSRHEYYFICLSFSYHRGSIDSVMEEFCILVVEIKLKICSEYYSSVSFFFILKQLPTLSCIFSIAMQINTVLHGTGSMINVGKLLRTIFMLKKHSDGSVQQIPSCGHTLSFNDFYGTRKHKLFLKR